MAVELSVSVLLLGAPRLRFHTEWGLSHVEMSWALPKVVNKEHIKHSCVCMCLIVLSAHYLRQGRLGNCQQGMMLPALTPMLSHLNSDMSSFNKTDFFPPLVVFDIQVSLPELVLSCL